MSNLGCWPQTRSLVVGQPPRIARRGTDPGARYGRVSCGDGRTRLRRPKFWLGSPETIKRKGQGGSGKSPCNVRIAARVCAPLCYEMRAIALPRPLKVRQPAVGDRRAGRKYRYYPAAPRSGTVQVFDIIRRARVDGVSATVSSSVPRTTMRSESLYYLLSRRKTSRRVAT